MRSGQDENVQTDDHQLARGGNEAGGDLADRFVASLTSRDADALTAMFCDEVDFRALTPSRTWEASTPREIVGQIILGSWFEPGDRIERVESVQAGRVGGRHRIGYRLVGANDDGPFAVEQQAYAELTDGKISWFRLVCSGFMPIDS